MKNFATEMVFRHRGQTTLFVSFVLFMIRTRYVFTNDTITQSQKLSVRDTIVSPGQAFELGFFNPGNSSKQYIGIWYKTTSYRKVVWVANRETPLQASDSASSLMIGEDGNLRLLDGMQNLVWLTNVSVQSNNSVAVLLDNGDLTLKDNISGLILWESFDYPCDTFLPGMTPGLNTKTGEKHFLTSWKTEDDPSPGDFVSGLTPERQPQAIIWNGSEPYWRGGPWNGGKFIGIEDSSEGYGGLVKLQSDNQQGNVYLTMELYNSFFYGIMLITPSGSLKLLLQEDNTQPMWVNWEAPANPCEIYGYCGPFGVCSKNKSRMCECLKGFVPKSVGDWREGNWGGGCVRRTELLCRNNSSGPGPVQAKSDGFWRFKRAKMPDHCQYFFNIDSVGCQQRCMSNCSCVAYAFLEKIGCMVWIGGLIDLQQYSSTGDDLFIRLAHSELDNGNKKGKLIASFTTISAVILMGCLIYGLRRRKAMQRVASAMKHHKIRGFFLNDTARTPRNTHRENFWSDNGIDEESSDFPLFEFDKIVAATDNFSRTNKLGEGGFGSVYKGKLENGQEIAVKRLSVNSGQGNEEFKNEIILISKLQHRNLVRLFGCCVQGGEKLLVYEYMTNKSLDSFLFDTKRRMQLNWVKRVEIIQGIARGLQYLHRDSRLRVIHRDLKASNILLDDDMNPKISDFGLARIFRGTQELANTRRVVGTFGYMSPEYAMGGLFSEKSDVYSFGVLLLEIVSGTKNTSFYDHKCLHLLGYAWELWEEKRELDLLDQELAGSYNAEEVTRCIQVGLLCVQDQAADRPIMSAVVVMLSSNTELPQPKKPTFTFQSLLNSDLQPVSIHTWSKNEMSTSIVEGR